MRTALALVATFAAALSAGALAATKVATFQVRIAIQSSCMISSASTRDGGPAGSLAATVDQTGKPQVQCTLAVPHNTTFSGWAMGGDGIGATYASYTASATGDGTPQNVTIGGRVPAPSTPGLKARTNTVMVTVTF